MKAYHLLSVGALVMVIYAMMSTRADGLYALSDTEEHHAVYPVNPMEPWRVYIVVNEDGKVGRVFLLKTYKTKEDCLDKAKAKRDEINLDGGQIESPWGTKYPVLYVYCKADGEVA